jgi:uncharacterized membrane protein YeiH
MLILLVALSGKRTCYILLSSLDAACYMHIEYKREKKKYEDYASLIFPLVVLFFAMKFKLKLPTELGIYKK